jgi:hypothetical protein
VLSNNNAVVALYKKTVYDADRSDDDDVKDAEGEVTEAKNDHIRFAANKAYLPVAGSAKAISLDRGEGTTGIKDAELAIVNVVIYDLTGRRVENPTRGIYIYNGKKPPVKIGSLLRNIQLRPGELYSYEKQQQAYKRLGQMNIFSNINFNLVPRGESDTLDINIATQLDKPYDFTFELNVTSKSNNQIGPGTKISLARKNVFRGGETLKFTLNGSYEWQTDKNVKGRASVINSWEIGTDISLSFPRIFFPIIHRRHLRIPRLY